jgi:hypothetical protein
MSTFEALVNELLEARLAAVRWLHGGRDLELQIAVAGQAGGRVLCRAVTGLHLDFDYRRGTGGAPQALSCDVERTVHGRLAFHWSFSPQGFVALECGELVLERDADDGSVAAVTPAVG